MIAKNLSAFEERYGFAADFGPFADESGLKNSGEQLQLGKPGDIDEDSVRQYIRIDRVTYSDGSHPEGEDPWPSEPDGNGRSLTKSILTLYGNDPLSWEAKQPTPGQ